MEVGPMFRNLYRGRRVLITGQTGFQGSWLAEWLLSLGAEVAGYSLNVPSEPSHFEALGLQDRIVNYSGDVRDLRSFEHALIEYRPSIVFHLAGQSSPAAALDQPKAAFDVNAGGTVSVLDALRRSSSVEAAVLSAGSGSGNDPYSAAAASAELAFRAYARCYFEQPGPGIVLARSEVVIGGGDFACSRLLPAAAMAWSRGEPAQISDPLARSRWIHVLDSSAANLWLAARVLDESSLSGETFQFTSAQDRSARDLLAELAKTLPDFQWMEGDEPGDSSSTRETSGDSDWSPLLSFEDSVRLSAEWYRSFYLRPGVPPPTQEQIARYRDLARQNALAWALD